MEIATSHNGEPHAGSLKTKPAPTRRSCKPSAGPVFWEMHPSKQHRHPTLQEGTLSRCQGAKAAIKSLHTGVNTEAMLHICLNYSAIGKNEKMPFEATWKDPEMILVCQVSHTDRQKWHRVLFIGGIEKYNQLKLISKHSLTPSYTANVSLSNSRRTLGVGVGVRRSPRKLEFNNPCGDTDTWSGRPTDTSRTTSKYGPDRIRKCAPHCQQLRGGVSPKGTDV